MSSLPKINWFVPQSFEDLQFQNTTLDFELLKRTQFFSGTYLNQEGFGIVDSQDPAVIASSDTNRPLQIIANESVPTKIDIKSGYVITKSGQVGYLDQDIVALPLASTIKSAINVVFIEYYLSDSEDEALDRYRKLQPKRYERPSDTRNTVQVATLDDFNNALIFSPSRLEDIVVLAVINVNDAGSGTLELDIDLTRLVYTYNRPWFSPADVKHRSIVGTGSVTDRNAHGITFNDLVSGYLTFYQQIMPRGLILSKDIDYSNIPGRKCSETITPIRILLDSTGSITARSKYGHAGAYYILLTRFPYQIGSAYLQGDVKIPIATDLIKGTNILVLSDYDSSFVNGYEGTRTSDGVSTTYTLPSNKKYITTISGYLKLYVNDILKTESTDYDNVTPAAPDPSPGYSDRIKFTSTITSGAIIKFVIDPVTFIIEYFVVDALEPPVSITSSVVTFRQPTNDEIVISDGNYIDTISDPSKDFQFAGPIPKDFNVYINNSGELFTTPQILLLPTSLDTIGTNIVDINTDMMDNGKIEIGLTKASNSSLMSIQLKLIGSDSDGNSLTETVIFSGESWGDVSIPGVENSNQFIETTNIFSSLQSIQVLSRSSDGPHSEIILYNKLEAFIADSLNELLQIAQVTWNGYNIGEILDNRNISEFSTYRLRLTNVASAAEIASSTIFTEDFNRPKFIDIASTRINRFADGLDSSIPSSSVTNTTALVYGYRSIAFEVPESVRKIWLIVYGTEDNGFADGSLRIRYANTTQPGVWLAQESVSISDAQIRENFHIFEVSFSADVAKVQVEAYGHFSGISAHSSMYFGTGSGTIGSTGATGTQGPIGPQGERGLPGGSTGITGSQGDVGLTGNIGLTGLTGDIGVVGPTGEGGDPGDKGFTGDRGLSGNQGFSGDKGLTGDPGFRGDTGDQGSTGDKGPAGGATGSTGPTGPPGAGATGATGPAGPPTGDIGATGNPGVTGPAGPAGGPVGATGPAGSGSTGATGQAGPPTGDVGPIGSTGAIGSTGSKGISGSTGTTGDTGDRGPTGGGRTGPTGETGEKGDPGDKGLTGNLGLTGDKGPAGGATGEMGSTGLVGPSGSTGSKGETGFTGAKGDTGTPGATGLPGSATGDTGERGPTGLTGTKGETGNTGNKGLTGDVGDPGDQGISGDVGLTGIQGLTGFPGPTGDDGDPGDKGLTGDLGLTGDKGPAGGATGDTGAIGFTGIKGDSGERGFTGDKGETGTQGATGLPGSATGDTGERGPTGLTGTKGETGNTGNKGLTGDVGDPGDQGITGDVGLTGIQGLIGFPGTTGDDGDPGDKGLTGDFGLTGDKGPAGGATGETGSTGLTGLKGDSGERGFTGDKGETGTQGATGLPGSATGDTGGRGSTGFTGAKGETGNTGNKGLTGEKGDPGDKGISGDVGLTGIQGLTGFPGITGDDGDPGDKGLTGDFGLTGDKGPAGAATGDTGAIGFTGIKGDSGERGLTGDKGETGSLGASGLPGPATGDTGERGSTGLTGAKGETGSTGNKGLTGDVGDPGDKGISGDIGLTGIQGLTGFPGSTGDDGDPGDKGLTGDLGLTGDKGPAGGATGDTGAIGITGTKGDTGEHGFTGDKGNTGFPGASGLPGPATGDTGERGSTGHIGSTGNTGDKGLTGDKGDSGDKGITGDVGITGPLGFTGNTGPLGLTGEKGDPGDKGNTGDQGSAGLPGASGVTGEQGDPGDKGLTGDGGSGDRGLTGLIGITGNQGLSGDIGISGISGNPGPTGLSGDQGLTGDKGPGGSATGDTGAVGPTGTVGSTGIQGIPGPPTGDKGETGDLGITGDTGVTGSAGQVSNAVMFNTVSRYSAITDANEEVLVVSSSSLYVGLTWARSGTNLTIYNPNHGHSTGDKVIVRDTNTDYVQALITTTDTNYFIVDVSNVGNTSGISGAYSLGFTFAHNGSPKLGGILSAPSGLHADAQLISMRIRTGARSGSTYDLIVPASEKNGAGGNTSMANCYIPDFNVRNDSDTLAAVASTMRTNIGGSYSTFQFGNLGDPSLSRIIVVNF